MCGLTLLTFDLLINIVILHALLAVSMPNILLVVIMSILSMGARCRNMC